MSSSKWRNTTIFTSFETLQFSSNLCKHLPDPFQTLRTALCMLNNNVNQNTTCISTSITQLILTFLLLLGSSYVSNKSKLRELSLLCASGIKGLLKGLYTFTGRWTSNQDWLEPWIARKGTSVTPWGSHHTNFFHRSLLLQYLTCQLASLPAKNKHGSL